jgi:hypothetical protein
MKFSVCATLSFLFLASMGRIAVAQQAQLDGRQNVITTAVPFLTITPDARSGAMGGAGVAISPDASSTYWNPAKLAFAPKQTGFGLSYTPWLRELVPDISLSYLSGYHRIDKLSAFGGSLRYFSLGDIQFTNATGESLGEGRPYEMAVDGSYARKLSDRFSVGVALRFILSDLASSAPGQAGAASQAGIAGAGDVSVFYTQPQNFFGREGELNLGANISNIGNKITYTDETQRDFIPTNFRLGGAATVDIDEFNKLTFTVDFNKLLVPTPDTVGPPGGNQGGVFIDTTASEDGVLDGMFSSFTDAPGGFEEELREVNTSIGVEYGYNDQFFLRTGYFYEHETKGNRQYATFGFGVNWKVVDIDLSYLVPTNSGVNNSPLANTIRLSAILAFDDFKDETSGKSNKRKGNNNNPNTSPRVQPLDQ